MATIKSHTDLEQSKKLSKMLPLESADSYYSWHDERYYIVNKDCPYPYSLKEKIPCWSLAVLLDVMKEPEIIRNSEGKWLIRVWYNVFPYSKGGYDNPIDACVTMIERLHEQKLI